MRVPEYTDHKPRSSRKTCRLADSTIGRDFAPRDFHDGGTDVARVLLRGTLLRLWLRFGHD